MPMTHISIRRGKDAAYKAALADGVYVALRETFAVPDDDRFIVIGEHDADTFFYGRSYLGIARSDDLVMIEITVSDTRDTAQKQALYRAIAEKLAKAPGVRPQDVLVILTEVKRENWSFGDGIAQYVDNDPAHA